VWYCSICNSINFWVYVLNLFFDSIVASALGILKTDRFSEESLDCSRENYFYPIMLKMHHSSYLKFLTKINKRSMWNYPDSSELVSSTTSNLGDSELLEFSLELAEFCWEVFFSLGSEFIDLDWLIHLLLALSAACVDSLFLYSILICVHPSLTLFFTLSLNLTSFNLFDSI